MVFACIYPGWLNHGFYNYQPNFFYCLAAANNYGILGLYFGYDGMVGDLTTYSDEAVKLINLKPGNSLTLQVVLQKNSNDEFNTPWDAKYLFYYQ